MTPATTDVNANVKRHREERRKQRAATQPAAPATAAPQPAGETQPRDVAGTGKNDRWATFNTFVDAVLAQTSEAEVRVWLVLYRDVKPGGLARVGMTDIARRAGLTRRGVVKAINGLKRRRLIEVTARGSINGTPNAYRLLNPGA